MAMMMVAAATSIRSSFSKARLSNHLSFRRGCEQLEARRLLAGQAFFAAEGFVIQGTSGNDTIELSEPFFDPTTNADMVNATVNGSVVGTFQYQDVAIRQTFL